ncbi:MAG: hypothetical protein R8K20_08670 [Gallionellaceae bacterium]
MKVSATVAFRMLHVRFLRLMLYNQSAEPDRVPAGQSLQCPERVAPEFDLVLIEFRHSWIAPFSKLILDTLPPSAINGANSSGLISRSSAAAFSATGAAKNKCDGHSKYPRKIPGFRLEKLQHHNL